MDLQPAVLTIRFPRPEPPRVATISWTIGPCVSLVLILACLADGCNTPIGVRRLGGAPAYREAITNALVQEVASEFSTQVLARHGLLERFEREPERVLLTLHGMARAEPRQDRLFALSELSYLTAKESSRKEYYLAAVFYAYAYLFSTGSGGVLEPYDPKFRLACDLYNRSLAEYLESPGGDVVLEGGTRELPFASMEISVSRPGFPWGPEDFNQFVAASGFLVRGLRDRHRHAGLGVPLIAIREPPEDRGTRTPDFLPHTAKVGATAFLRIPLQDLDLGKGELSASLELYAPFNTVEVTVEGHPVPLEADLTAPLAYGLEESRIWDFELGAFFSADSAVNTGIFLLQPYFPGKIPVVFVHGTASSPVRWAEMFNGLQGYQELRENFQFWFFLYTTGNPIAYSAQLLREALHDVHQKLDPEGTDAALQQMVIVGHSQGGILTRMQTIDSGTVFWNAISEKKFEDLDLPAEQKDVLRRALFFKRVPFVRRIVFLATPHRGSFLAANWVGRLASYMVQLPKGLVDTGRSLFQTGDAHFIEEFGEEIPTSIENMDPDNRFIKALNTIPLSPEAKSHSIIAIKRGVSVAEGNDGVVEYSSAHVDGVASEYVVFTGHSCQSNSMTILEVRRILLQHLSEYASSRAELPNDQATIKKDGQPGLAEHTIKNCKPSSDE